MDIKRTLENEVQSKMQNLEGMNVASEEYQTAVKSVTELVDRVIDLEKLENENESNLRTIEENEKDRRTRNILAWAGLAIPTGVTIWGTLKSFKFEENGTVTTIMGRGFINKLLPKK